MGSKLLYTIGLFSEGELTLLKKFINNSYFNTGTKASNYIILFEVLQSKAFEKKISNSDEHELYKKVFPNEDFVQGKLEKLMSGLLRLIEKFIETNFAESIYDQSKKTLVQAIFFRERGAAVQHEEKIKKLKTGLKNQKIKDEKYFYNKFLNEEEIEHSNEQFNHRTSDLNLPATLENLDVYYIYIRLRTTVSLLAQNIHAKVDTLSAVRLLDSISELIENEEYLQIPIIQVYYRAYKMLRLLNGENHSEFLKYRKFFKAVSSELPPLENKSLRTLMRAYAVEQYNSGKKQFLQQAFLLFREHLDEGYLYYKNKILPSTLQSIVKLGIRNKEFEWVYSFLQNHKDRITGSKQTEDVYNYNMAYYFFSIGEYEKASDNLTDIYEDFYYKIGAKRMEIMIFFEQNSPLSEPRLRAFKIYIFRLSKSSLPDKQRLANNNFTALLFQIIHPKTKRNQKRINRIKERIDNKKVLFERDWLLEKLEEQK